MSRRSSSNGLKRRQPVDDNDIDDDESRESTRRRSAAAASQDEDDEGLLTGSQSGFAFSQQIPELSQSVLPERAYERRNLEGLGGDAGDTKLLQLSRLVLFKALDNEPIDRVKAIKDAGLSSDKISGAAYQEVASRLQNVFGFELKQTPPFMQKYKSLPAKFKDRYYVINTIQDTEDGQHSKTIHSVHKASKIEKGVLILTVALIFCKGESRSDGSRHILARDLYRLMHQVDENIPQEPPAQGTARAKSVHQKHQRLQGGAGSCTPNFDVMLNYFVHSDYLVMEKATDENFHSQPLEEGDVLYSTGPRAALELGRRQIITFCAEILGEEPDPSMLKEIENDGGEDDQELFMEAAEVN